MKNQKRVNSSFLIIDRVKIEQLFCLIISAIQREILFFPLFRFYAVTINGRFEFRLEMGMPCLLAANNILVVLFPALPLGCMLHFFPAVIAETHSFFCGSVCNSIFISVAKPVNTIWASRNT